MRKKGKEFRDLYACPHWRSIHIYLYLFFVNLSSIQFCIGFVLWLLLNIKISIVWSDRKYIEIWLYQGNLNLNYTGHEFILFGYCTKFIWALQSNRRKKKTPLRYLVMLPGHTLVFCGSISRMSMLFLCPRYK